MAMDFRRHEILDSVDNLVNVHDKWEDDPQATAFPVEAFGLALTDAGTVCDPHHGDVPRDCLDVVVKIIDLLAEWEMYVDNGRHDSRGYPLSPFWRAYRALVHSRQEAQPTGTKHIEHPKVLREQKVPDQQIAKMWGARSDEDNVNSRWYGPFFDDFGNVNSAAIQQEIDKPGSILGENPVPPSELARVERERAAAKRRLQAVEQRMADRRAQRFSEEDVASLLREGQYLSTIMKVSQWSEEEVMQLADDLEITPAILPNLASERGTYDRELSEADDASLQPRSHEPETTEDQIPVTEVSKDEVESSIISMFEENRDLSASEIAEAVGTSAQKVGLVLKKHREAATAGV